MLQPIPAIVATEHPRIPCKCLTAALIIAHRWHTQRIVLLTFVMQERIHKHV